MREMNMMSAKAISTPGSTETRQDAEEREASPPLEAAEATKYRALAARLNYLSLDRPDLQHAAKETSKCMSSPRQGDWTKLKRVARYLMGAPRLVQEFKWQAKGQMVRAHTDSDWAGDKVSRKSTSGGVVSYGDHMIKTWASTQQVVALSSGEAELYALVKGASQAVGIMSMMMDYGIKAEGIVHTDATAAIGIAHRVGLGRTRHINVQYLWIQEKVQEKQLTIKKIGTNDNPADLLTKFLKQELIEKHLKTIGCWTGTSRAKSAPQLQQITRRDEWIGHGGDWARAHCKPRHALFTPMKVPKGPGCGEHIGSWRVTTGVYEDGECFTFIDQWKALEDPHRQLPQAWTGTTYFSDPPCPGTAG